MSPPADRTESVFAGAVAVSVEERAAYLDRECASDPVLRKHVEALLRAHDRSSHLLDKPVPGGPEQTVAFASSEKPGTIVAGRYKLLESIGEGGMGTVWVAEQTEPVRRKVALKLIKAGMDSRSVLARFEAERQALAMMDHPNIAKVLDGGLTDLGRPYFVMEYVKGVPITEYCDATRLSIQERLQLFMQVCQAVQHAHQKGIIHRDLKPSNILVAPYDDKPVPKIIDFGLAKAMHQSLTERTLHTAHESVLGTPLYMSPEQAQLNNLDVDTRSDIYSLGVLLYELLTGTTPLEKQRFKQAAWDEVRRIIREEEPPRPSTRLSSIDTLPSLAAGRHTDPLKLTRLVKGELDWIVMKALEKDRTRRYETANGFARDIQRYLSDEVVEARPPSAGYRLRKLVSRNKGKVVAAGLVLVALLVGMAGTTWGLIEAEKQRRLAIVEAAAKEEARQQEAQQRQRAEAAREQAQKRLTQIEKANDILGSIFENLDPKEIAKNERPLQAILVEKLDKAVAQLEGESIGDPLVVAAMQTKFGVSLLGLGEPDKAIVLLEKSLATHRTTQGSDHKDTLTCMNNLGVAYQNADKHEKAIQLLSEACKLKELHYGSEHLETLVSLNNLAISYDKTRKLDIAIPIFERTLAARKKKLGLDHPQTLNSMNNLGSAYCTAGKFDRALPLLEEALTLTTGRFGDDHPDTLSSIHSLAIAYRDAGNISRALPLYEKEFLLAKKKLGPDHPFTLSSMTGLAAAYWSDKKFDKSVPLFEESFKLQEKKLGRYHNDTLLTHANLGVNYKDAGRLKEAIPYLEQSYRDTKNKSQFNWVGPQLVDGYAKAGRRESAHELAIELLAEARKAIPPTSLELAGLLGSLSWSLLQAKDYLYVEKLLRECLSIREKAQPDAWRTFSTKSMLGEALLGKKKYVEAEPLLLSGYEGLRKQYEKMPELARPRLPEALDRLIQLYTETNKPDEVKKWQAEKAKLPRPEEKK